MRRMTAKAMGARRARRMIAAILAMPLCLALAACGPRQGDETAKGAGPSPGTGGAAKTAVTCKAPDFAGPYAAEFKNAYERSTTELAKRILEDCQVSDAELTEIFDAQNACLAPYGLVSSKGSLTQVRASGLSD